MHASLRRGFIFPYSFLFLDCSVTIVLAPSLASYTTVLQPAHSLALVIGPVQRVVEEASLTAADCTPPAHAEKDGAIILRGEGEDTEEGVAPVANVPTSSARLTVAQRVPVTLSYDTRAIPDESAARFLQALVEYIRAPTSLL